MNQEQLGSQKRHPVNQNPHTGETLARLRSNASAEPRTHSTRLPMPSGLEKAGPPTPMASSWTVRTSDERLATRGRLYSHVRVLAWSARVRSGDLLSHGARRQHGARVRRVRGTRRLFGASHLALFFPFLGLIHQDRVRCPWPSSRHPRPGSPASAVSNCASTSSAMVTL